VMIISSSRCAPPVQNFVIEVLVLSMRSRRILS
jgi:hypothetical protein